MRSSVVLHDRRPADQSAIALPPDCRFAELTAGFHNLVVVVVVVVAGHSHRTVEAEVADKCMTVRAAAAVRRVAGEVPVVGSCNYEGVAVVVVGTGRWDTAAVAAEDLRIVRCCMVESQTCQVSRKPQVTQVWLR